MSNKDPQQNCLEMYYHIYAKTFFCYQFDVTICLNWLVYCCQDTEYRSLYSQLGREVLFLPTQLHSSTASIVLLDQLSIYEGGSINKLQYSSVLLVSQILKIQNICLVGDLILSSSYEFYDDDFTVASFINIKYGKIASEILP